MEIFWKKKQKQKKTKQKERKSNNHNTLLNISLYRNGKKYERISEGRWPEGLRDLFQILNQNYFSNKTQIVPSGFQYF